MVYPLQHNVAYYHKALVHLLCLFGLAGCATFSQDGGFNDVQETTRRYIKQTPVWAHSDTLKAESATQVQALLKTPLSVDDAVQVALLNNAKLQADFYALQLAEADLVEAGRLPNPSFSMFYAKHNGDYKIEQSLTMNIMALLTMSKATAVEKRRFKAMQNNAVLQVLRLARQTRNAYINALAAKQTVYYLEQVKTSAAATFELAKRMHKEGNWNALEAGREQSFYIESALALSHAENACLQAEEQLTALLGLAQPADFKLPAKLMDLPISEQHLKKVNQADFSKRLDLQQIRLQNAALAKQLGLTKTTRFINVLEIGPASVLEGRRDDPYKKGLELRFELPLFDWGTAKVKRADARYMQGLHEANNQAIVAASEVRGQYHQYMSSYDIAKSYRDELVPLRQSILKESLLQYNGMLMSPFELMTVAREQVDAMNQYIEALRIFWLAESDLEMTLVGSPLEGYTL